MDLSTIFLIVLLSGAIIGFKKPLLVGFFGLLLASTLSIIFISSNILFSVIVTPIYFILGVSSGLASFIFYSGLHTKRHKDNVAYVGGFGAHTSWRYHSFR